MNYKETLVINLIGGPCSGKSTVAAELFSRLKKMGIKSPSGMELNGKRVCSAYFTILDRKQRLGLIDKDGKEVEL